MRKFIRSESVEFTVVDVNKRRYKLRKITCEGTNGVALRQNANTTEPVDNSNPFTVYDYNIWNINKKRNYWKSRWLINWLFCVLRGIGYINGGKSK